MIITATRPHSGALFIVIVVKAFSKAAVHTASSPSGLILDKYINRQEAATWRSPDIALQKVFQGAFQHAGLFRLQLCGV